MPDQENAGPENPNRPLAFRRGLKPGATAIVFTSEFRCLAVLQSDGRWKEVYGDGKVIEGVTDFKSVSN
jgi:hypothetical protein